MKHLLSILFLFVFGLGFAQTKDSLSLEEQQRREKNIQAGNPFKKFGYTPKIHTLSKGKYLEFHDLDSIVKIGSFSYHVKNKTITGYIQHETKYSEATLRPEIVSRWFSPDPLSDEFPSWSPYNFVQNNPINLVDIDGLYPRPVLVYNEATNTYRFTNAAAHLLSLVSGVDKRQIQNAVVQPRAIGQYRPWYSAKGGGGAMTLGGPNYYTITYTENWFEDDASKYDNSGYGQNTMAWLRLSSHEVGHIPQIYREGSLGSYAMEFLSQYTDAGNHDGAPYEQEADTGRNVFNDFNNFINDTYGKNSLENLFNNNTENVITKRLDKWWAAFEDERGKKTERTESFLEGLKTNLDNYSEGQYFYNGTDWVKKN